MHTNVVAHLLCVLHYVQVAQLGCEVLLVSQFTLYGRVRKKPDFSKAMPPQQVREASADGCLGLLHNSHRQLALSVVIRSWGGAAVTHSIDVTK